MSSVELVFDRLLAEIVSGRHPPGAHLPSERDLAKLVGASRSTLREALRRLADWGLIAARRGSGVVVRAPREWSIEILPAYLRHGVQGGPAAAAVLRDLLFLRRSFEVDVFRLLGGRLSPGSLARARASLARAWEARHDPPAYVRADLDVLREVTEAAAFLPALWMLNSLQGVYFQLAESLALAGGGTLAPADYLSSNGRVLDALEAGDGERAAAIADAYLRAHDRALLAALGVPLPDEGAASR